MITSQIYIAITIVVLAIIALIMFFVKKNKKDKKLTLLASFAFGFVLSGIVFSDDRLIGYSLMGIGIILAVIDIIKQSKKK
jgi:hypothetical protein